METLRKILLLLALCPLLTLAQTETEAVGKSSAPTAVTVTAPRDTATAEGVAIPYSTLHSYYEPIGTEILPPAYGDSLRYYAPNYWGGRGLWHYPLSWDEWCGWGLHKGLNVSLSASVFGEFGKHARHGAGFGQRLSVLYADQLTDRLSFAVGGYVNNAYWAHSNYRDAGLTAQLTYQIDNHWDAFVYGHKSLLPTKSFVPRPLYDMHAVGDVLGGGVQYNFSPNFSIGVSVERRWLPHDTYYNPYY